MKSFEELEPEPGVVCYRLVFEKDEYVAVFTKAFGTGDPIYSRMQYKKHGEKQYSLLAEQGPWSIAISQVLKLIDGIKKVEIDPNGGLF